MMLTAYAHEIAEVERYIRVAYVLRSQLDDVMNFLGRSDLAFSETVDAEVMVPADSSVADRLPSCGLIE